MIAASFFCVQNERAQRLTKTSGRLLVGTVEIALRGKFWCPAWSRFWVDFEIGYWVGCLDCSLGKFEVYKLLWKWLFWISDTLGNMIFNIFLKLKEKLLLSGKFKLKVFSRYFATIFRPNWAKKLGYISKFTHFKLLNRLNTFIFFLVLWSNKKIQIFIFIFHSWETPPPPSIFQFS